jgi:DNA transposition AAA+ family ATPase
MPKLMKNRVLEKLQSVMKNEGYTTRQVSKSINYSHSALCSYLAETYKADASAIEAALINWFSRKGDPLMLEVVDESNKDLVEQSTWIPRSFIETKASADVVSSCFFANEQKCMVAVVGAPGVGKTLGVREFMRRARLEEINFVAISTNCMATPAHLMRKIADEMRLATRGSAAEIADRIIGKLRRDPAVVIIDEAQHLNVRCLEALRHVHDESGCGLAFIGSQMLYRTLTDGDETHYELKQLQDRIVDIKTVGVLDYSGLTRFASAWLGMGQKTLDTGAIGRLRAMSKGVPRRIDRLLRAARRISDEQGGVEITADLLEAAEKRLVKEAA